jgi:hypothetical protein
MSLTTDWGWIKTHLILLAFAATLSVGAVYGVLYIQSSERAAAEQRQAVIVDALTAQNKIIQQNVAQQIAALNQQNQQLELQNQQLSVLLAKRQVIEVALPKQNATLSATQVATQLGGVAQNNDVLLPLSNAQSVLTAVQLVPLLQQDKVDLTASNGLLKNEVINAQSALDLERKAHTSDNTTSAATIKLRDDTILTLRAENRKSKLKYFGLGYVAGFVSACALHAAAVI